MSDRHAEAEERIQELFERAEGLDDKRLFRSANRVLREVLRVAKAEELLIPYLYASGWLMGNTNPTLDVDERIECAVESIALMESEEKARQFQPEFPEEMYWQTVGDFLADSYESLASGIGERDGFNSDGMHELVEEGLEVCRRTGNSGRIPAFHCHAQRIASAAGDLDMAIHHAHRTIETAARAEQYGYQWHGLHSIVCAMLIKGNLDEALRYSGDSLRTIVEHGLSTFLGVGSYYPIAEILWLRGRPTKVETVFAESGMQSIPEIPEDEEALVSGMDRAKMDALIACCRGEYAKAIERLGEWDRRLTNQNCLDEWFEVRLRLIGALYLAREMDKMHAMARQLEAKAKKARDWLSLNRLKGLLDGTVHPTPLLLLKSLTEGPFAAPNTKSTTTASMGNGEQAAAEKGQDGEAKPDESQPETPLKAKLDELSKRFNDASGDEAVAGEILDEMLAIPAETVDSPKDAARLVFVANYAARASKRTAEAWTWAETFAEKFARDGMTLNVVAYFGYAARYMAQDEDARQEPDDIVSQDRVEALFTASLDLHHESANCFARAGSFYMAIGKKGDGERCYARAFQLDRVDPRHALTLAQVYTDSDRPRDALAVLDLAIREGCDDARVLWEAGMTAMNVEHHEVALSYLTRYEELQPNERWTQYYRTLALLATDQPEEALVAIGMERERDGEWQLHTRILTACAQAKLDRIDDVRESLAEILKFRLADVDYLTFSGIADLYEHLYGALSCLPDESEENTAARALLLESGLAPNAFFHDRRDGQEVVEGINYYICQIEQPLDDDWSRSLACLPGQTEWTGYEAIWGVLAHDEAEAERLVLAAQQECAPQAARLVSCELEEEDYNDAVGIVWQGARRPIGAEDPEP